MATKATSVTRKTTEPGRIATVPLLSWIAALRAYFAMVKQHSCPVCSKWRCPADKIGGRSTVQLYCSPKRTVGSIWYCSARESKKAVKNTKAKNPTGRSTADIQQSKYKYDSIP
jgi:hypothetical protein